MRILVVAAAAALFLAGPAVAGNMTCSTYGQLGLTCTVCCDDDTGVCSAPVCSAPLPEPEPPVDESSIEGELNQCKMYASSEPIVVAQNNLCGGNGSWVHLGSQMRGCGIMPDQYYCCPKDYPYFCYNDCAEPCWADTSQCSNYHQGYQEW